MTDNNNHIIWTQAYQIELDDKKEAYRFQSAISLLQESRVTSLLNRIMNNFNDEDSVYQFNKIELDLGVISKSNYENELIFKLEEALTNYFKSNILDNGTLRSGKKIVLHDGKLEQFEHFLVNGYLKWNVSFSKTPSTLLKELLSEEETGLNTLLQKSGQKEIIRKRLVLQFDDELLEKVVVAVAKKDGNYIIAYKRNMLRHQQKHPLVDSSFNTFRNAIWDIILTYLFVDSNGYYNQKNFLKYLITKIAKKYNLTYELLLTVILKGVKLEQKYLKKPGFKKIILELAKELHQKENHKKTSLTVKKDLAVVLVSQINHYLKSGAFSGEEYLDSRQGFNHQLSKLLRSKHKLLRYHLTNWLTDPAKRSRFLLLVNDDTLLLMLQCLESPSIEENLKFIRILENSKGYLPAESKDLLDKINWAGKRLIPEVYEENQFSKQAIISKFIKKLLEEFDQQQEAIFELFDVLKFHMPAKYGKMLQKVQSEHIEKRGSSNAPIKNQLPTNGKFSSSGKAVPDRLILQLLEKELDKLWFHKKLFSEWARETVQLMQKTSTRHEVPLDVVFDALIQFLREDPKQQPVVDRLLKVRASGFYLNALSKAVEKQTLEFRKQMVYYILNKGKIPWWHEGTYSMNNFNKDFASLWVSVKQKKQILKLIQKNAREIPFHGIINTGNLQRVWKALDKSAGKIYASLFGEIHQLLREHLLPVSYIGVKYYHEFVRETLRMMFYGPQSHMDRELWNYLQKWVKSSGVAKSESVKRLLINILRQISTKTSDTLSKWPLNEWINDLSDITASENEVLEQAGTIWKLSTVFESSGHKKQASELAAFFEEVIITKPERFDDWLNISQFRENLLSELPEKAVEKLIKLKLNIQQRQLLDQSNAILHAIGPFISTQDFKKIGKVFLGLVLLKLSIGGITAWLAENWSNLIFQSLTTVVGDQQALAVLSKVKGKLFSSGEAQHTEEIELLDQIFEKAGKRANLANILVNTVARKKNTPQDYRKLGEEKPREFINPLFIKNAGLIILAPYLGMLFEKCGLTDEEGFIGEEQNFRAVHLLEYAATGEVDKEEHELVINKLLCGMPLADPLERNIELTENEKQLVRGLLTAVTRQWSVLKGTSVEGLRVSFLQREGKLEEQEDQFYLKVAQKPFDMLLDQIPWNISKVKLSWMKKLLLVEWR